MEDKKKKERDQQPKSNQPPKNLNQSREQQRMNMEGSSSRSASHNIQASNSAPNHRSHSQHHQQHQKERSHHQQHGQHREKTDKHHSRSGSSGNHNLQHREGGSTKIYLNGVSSSGSGGTSAQRHHKPEHRGEQRHKIVYQVDFLGFLDQKFGFKFLSFG